MGFWVLLMITPLLVAGAGSLTWFVAAFLGLIMTLWSRYFSTVFLTLVKAKTLGIDQLGPKFNQILERSRLDPASVAVFQAGPTSRRWTNALGLRFVGRSKEELQLCDFLLF
jgi:hypothetical protein